MFEGSTRVCNQKPLRIGKALFDPCTANERDVAVRHDGRPVRDADVERAFVGRSFWFGRWGHGQQVDTWTKPERAVLMWADICPKSAYRTH
jgi:hypothetical protein